jgi:hypothetical protein
MIRAKVPDKTMPLVVVLYVVVVIVDPEVMDCAAPIGADRTSATPA